MLNRPSETAPPTHGLVTRTTPAALDLTCPPSATHPTRRRTSSLFRSATARSRRDLSGLAELHAAAQRMGARSRKRRHHGGGPPSNPKRQKLARLPHPQRSRTRAPHPSPRLPSTSERTKVHARRSHRYQVPLATPSFLSSL